MRHGAPILERSELKIWRRFPFFRRWLVIFRGASQIRSLPMQEHAAVFVSLREDDFAAVGCSGGRHVTFSSGHFVEAGRLDVERSFLRQVQLNVFFENDSV